jgi:CDP-diacylglycerol--glycerol-3-phosphate 3-phosphatidyltransferase
MNFGELRTAAGRMIVKPIAPALARAGFTPNVLTIIGLVINLASAALVALGYFLAGALVILFSGLFDMLDGAVARYNQQTTRFGALLDSTIDRVQEGAVYFALAWFFYNQGQPWEVYLSFGAMIGSFLVSYVRARAEGLGIECKEGIFTRPERIILLALGLIINQMLIILAIMVVMTFFTVIQRVVVVWRKAGKT